MNTDYISEEIIAAKKVHMFMSDGYDGSEVGYSIGKVQYHLSVDALIPVFEKLGLNVNLSYQPSTKTYRCRVFKYGKTYHINEGKPPKKYKSAAIASVMAAAQAIEEL